MLLWGTIVRLYKRWRAYEQTYEELMRLDDRELADINVRRRRSKRSRAMPPARSNLPTHRDPTGLGILPGPFVFCLPLKISPAPCLWSSGRHGVLVAARA